MAEEMYFTPDRRAANMEVVINKMQEIDNLTFDNIIFTFADMIHTTFLKSLTVGKPKEQREEITKVLTGMNNELTDVLNENQQLLAYDVVVLSHLLMDAIEMAVNEGLKEKATEEAGQPE